MSRLLFIILVTAAFPTVLQAEPAAGLFAGAPRDAEGRFTNLKGEIAHGTPSVRIPFILRRFGTYFRNGDGAPERVANDGLWLRENARHSSPSVTWVGHATLLVQMAHVTFLTDPIWSDWPSPLPYVGPRRYVEPGLALKDLPDIDFVVISHNHYDHLDLPTLKLLAERSPDTIFYVPLGNRALLDSEGIQNVIEMDWGDTASFGEATIHCLPSQHWSKRSVTDDRKALWASWAVTGPDKKFYFAGDTGYFDRFKTIGERLGPFDLAAVPVGAYEPVRMMRESHLNPEEAITAALDLKAERALAIHFGTFDLSDEPIAEPPIRFLDAAAGTRLDKGNAWVLKIGETRVF